MADDKNKIDDSEAKENSLPLQSNLENCINIKCEDASDEKNQPRDASKEIDSLTSDDSIKNEASKIPRFLSYEELKRQSVDIHNFAADFSNQNDTAKRCHSTLSVAVSCLNKLSEEQIRSVLNVLPLLQDGDQSNDFTTCQALLLHSLTKKATSLDQLSTLEDFILKVSNSVIPDASFNNQVLDTRLLSLKREYNRTALRLCQELLSEKALDLCNVDVLAICCSSLRNFITNPAGAQYQYSEQTLKFTLGIIGKATQEIISESLTEDEDTDVLTVSSYVVHQSLIVLEHILSEDSLSHRKTLDHEDFSLLHCLTRLLEWCVSALFYKDQDSSNVLTPDDILSNFYLSTLVSILKILSILSFNPDQYSNFTNVKGLMEKIMICILKSHFWSESNHFDVLILGLELLINFFLKNKKTFVLLCLKKFKTCEEEILSVEGLLKILSNSIDKINEIQPRVSAASARMENANERNGTSRENSEASNGQDDAEATMNFVLEAADEDMMLSTIVGFVSVLLVFFMDTKASFVNFIKERLPSERSEEVVAISKKFIKFALITGSMPESGILMLRHSIKKMSELYATT